MKIFSLAVVLAPPSGPSAVLSQASDLSSFSFYQKGSVGEFMTFFTKTVAERTPQGQRQSVQENNYTAHVYNRGGAEQLAGAYLSWSSHLFFISFVVRIPVLSHIHIFLTMIFKPDYSSLYSGHYSPIQNANCPPLLPPKPIPAVIITDQEYPVRPAFSLLTKVLDDFTAKVPQSSFSNPSAIQFGEINAYVQKYQDPRQADNIMRVQQELDETKIVLVSPTWAPFRALLSILRSICLWTGVWAKMATRVWLLTRCFGSCSIRR